MYRVSHRTHEVVMERGQGFCPLMNDGHHSAVGQGAGTASVSRTLDDVQVNFMPQKILSWSSGPWSSKSDMTIIAGG